MGYCVIWVYVSVWENCDKENFTEEIVIFPNPFEGQISISIPNEAGFDIMVLLYDHFGRLVLSRAMKSVEANVFMIETDDACLQPGAYELMIIAGEQVYRRILMKK